MAILGFAGTGAPLFGSLFFADKFNLDVASRGDVYAIIGLAAFLGLPVAYVLGDRYFRKAPQRPMAIAGICICVYGVLFVASLYVPKLWMCVALQTVANAAVQPLAICIFLTLAATAPAEMRTICFAMFGVYSLVFGGFTGSVLLGAISDTIGGLHGIVVALTLIGPVCVAGGIFLALGSRHVRRDITMVIEDVLERYAEGKRRRERRRPARTAGPQPRLLLRHQPGPVRHRPRDRPGRDRRPPRYQRRRQVHPLRAVSGLEHPHRGVVRLYGINSTYLEPEQIIGLDVALLVGGKMTFPGLTVRDNLRVGGFTLRKERAQAATAQADALEAFPELAGKLDQVAGTLSGGEQQMLALARVMMTQPKLLLIDELALGLAPKTVDRLMEMVREVNRRGTTVVLVEQSVNRAASIASRAFFIERGQIRFDGPITELLERDDLLRPVFLAEAGTGLG